MPGRPKVLLIDADVLIDYQKSDLGVLGIANHYVGEVHVLTTILDEVDGLDRADCERIGLKIIEPELAQLNRASARNGRLSFRDRLCLIVASENGSICVTNDRPLRKACGDAGVAILWGLEIMSVLVQGEAMEAADAIRTAEQIRISNPLHISKQIVDRFSRTITDIEKERRGR